MTLSKPAAKQLVLLAVLIAASITAVSLFWKSATQPAADVGQQIATKFFADIQAGHPDQAWDATTTEFKSARGKEAFIRDVKQRAWLKEPLQFFAVNSVTVQNQPRSEYLFRAPDGNAKTNTRVVIGRENGDWKVDLCVFPD